MSAPQEARTAVLRAIRDNLAASAASGAVPPAAAHPASQPPALDQQEERVGAATTRAARFAERLAAVGARCWIASGPADAAAILKRIVAEAGADNVIRSDAALLDHVADWARPVQTATRADLLACDAGVTSAQLGIVETGTLVLESARERSRLLSLLPRLHVAVLEADRLCETMEEALARVRGVDDANVLASRAVTFITGPSRTSDIELTLVIGVHGPQILHVIVIPAAESLR